MKKNITLTIGVIVCLTLGGCRSYFPAQSEKAYQESITAIKKELRRDGYNLVKFQSPSNTIETYTFRNNLNDTVEFTLYVDRDGDLSARYITTVEMRGCSTSNMLDYDYFCSNTGVVATTLRNTRKYDTTGSKFDVGATIGNIVVFTIVIPLISGAFAYFVILRYM